MSLLDCFLIIPLLNMLLELDIEITLFHWILTFIFVISARLNRINFKMVMNIQELHIVYENGITLFSISNSRFEPTLVGSAMT